MDHAETTPLHAMQPLNRFSERAADYAKYRPDYPEAAIDLLLDGTPQLAVADVGAGTGISSRLLAARGAQVLAIEPNATMRQAAQPHPGVVYRDGTGERTGLRDTSVDLVTCFQAFHWFEPEPSLLEFRRILKPTGRLALVWNDRDPADEFTQAYSHLIRLVSNHHPAERRLVAVAPLYASMQFVNVRCATFTHRQRMTLDGLLGRANSVSYIPREGTAHQQLSAGLQELHARFCDRQGLVDLVYKTNVYLADPSAG